jgi:uncharacterized membrane protein YtjA (UPF0391 family)
MAGEDLSRNPRHDVYVGATADPGDHMSLLRWAIIFLVISLVAGALGYSGISAGAARISKILFAIFGVLFVIFVLLAFAFGGLFL